MNEEASFEEINDAKVSMDHIYDQPDPRAYFRELRSVGYAIPGAAKPIFQNLISRRRNKRNQTVRVLDIGCSYGINAALLKHDLSVNDLYDRWSRQQVAEAASENVIENDKAYFAALDKVEDIEVIGLDIAENAVAFGEKAGLLDEGFAVDLESEPLPERAQEELAEVDLITSTGCVGYVTETSFERLLPVVTQGCRPWFANFVLRMFPFDPIEDALTDAGYVTEKLDGQTFVQREFASPQEQEQVLHQLDDQGIDPVGKEAEGHLLAEFFLSRPAADVAQCPIRQIVAE